MAIHRPAAHHTGADADTWAGQPDLPTRSVISIRHIASLRRSVKDNEVKPRADGAAPGLRLTSRPPDASGVLAPPRAHALRAQPRIVACPVGHAASLSS
jgi:hypothetical protein